MKGMLIIYTWLCSPALYNLQVVSNGTPMVDKYDDEILSKQINLHVQTAM